MPFYPPAKLWEWIEQNYDDILRIGERVFRHNRGWRVVGLTSDELAHLTACNLVGRAQAEGGLTIDTPAAYFARCCQYDLANLLRWQWVREHEPLEEADRAPIMRLVWPSAD